MKRLHYNLSVALIFLLSFRLYASQYYPALNSDNAVTILMIHYFSLPGDLYFWGQDRLGSLIPLIGSGVYHAFNLSAVFTESVVHYLILLLGFLSFASFLNSYFIRLLFALVWFFPPMRLVDLTQFAFGLHYSLIGMGCYLFSKYNKVKTDPQRRVWKHVYLGLTALVFITAIWVSDMALVSVALFVSIQAYFSFRDHKPEVSALKSMTVLYAVVGLLAGYGFISYAKQTAATHQSYTIFSSWENIRSTLSTFLDSIRDIFLFEASEPFTSIYSFMVVVIIAIIAVSARHFRPKKEIRALLTFFLADAVVLLALILVSEWTFLNGVPRRYFTCTYASLGFACMLLLDNIRTEKSTAAKAAYLFTVATVVIGGIGAIYNLKFIFPKTLTSKVAIVKEFEQLGRIGIISEYWNSYITACVKPGQIIATPHDQSGVRNPDLVKEVFQQDSIYVIRDMWMKAFPDTLVQFSHTLVQDGPPFHLGDCDVRKYRLLHP